MKKLMSLSLVLLLMFVFTPAALSQRYVERHSTDTGNDLQRISFAGKIHSISEQVATVHSDCGEVYRVQLGPSWYWREQGYRLRSGIRVEVSGWWDSADRHSCFAGRIAGNGFSFELASSEGYPLWANPEHRRGFRPRVDHYHHYYYHPPRAIPPWWRRHCGPHWRHHHRHWRHHRYWGHHRDYCPPRPGGYHHGHGHRHGHYRRPAGHDCDPPHGGNRSQRNGRRPR